MYNIPIEYRYRYNTHLFFHSKRRNKNQEFCSSIEPSKRLRILLFKYCMYVFVLYLSWVNEFIFYFYSIQFSLLWFLLNVWSSNFSIYAHVFGSARHLLILLLLKKSHEDLRFYLQILIVRYNRTLRIPMIRIFVDCFSYFERHQRSLI